MAAINLINPTGRIVQVNRLVLSQIKERNELHLYSPFIKTVTGTGDPMRILILHSSPAESFNGLGDAIHALPAISAKIAEGYEVVINDNRFRAPIFRSIGAKMQFDSFTDEREYAEKRKKEFGMIYCCRNWCIEHDWETEGSPTLDRFALFAEIIGTKIPDTFSFPFYKQDAPRKNKEILICTRGTAITRNYPYEEQLLSLIGDSFPVAHFGSGGIKTKSFKELASRIYNAKGVISIDTGILAVALALGTPTIGLFGATDERMIANQFAKYVNGRLLIIRSQKEDTQCQRPCSFDEIRGYGGSKCERKEGDCMKEIAPELIAERAKEFFI